MTAEDLEGAKTAIREKKVDKEDKETKNELQKVGWTSFSFSYGC